MYDKRKQLIFVIDSHSGYRALTVRTLAIAGYTHTLCFDSVMQCIDYLDLDPKLIVTEYPNHHEKINGLSFLDYVREVTPEVLVIFLTMHDHLQSAIKSMTSGATDYILKSHSAHEKLVRRINEIYRHHQAFRQNSRSILRLTLSLALIITLLCWLVMLY